MAQSQGQTRRQFLTALAAGAASLAGLQTHAQRHQGSRPNIVFIMTDDQAAFVMPDSDRYPFLDLPNLARLRSEGMDFANAFVTTALCSPCRATCLTGVYAHTHGVIANEMSDPDPAAPWLPSLLQEAGYETAFVGKWHMAPSNAPRKGFDHWFSFKGQGVYFDPVINVNGDERQFEGYMTDILTEEAVRYLRQPHEKPFCLFLWHKAMHGPFKPAERHQHLWQSVTLDEPPAWRETYAYKPRWLRRGMEYGLHAEAWEASEGKPVPERLMPPPWLPAEQTGKLTYLCTIKAVDEGLGEVLDVLDEQELAHNTLVLFTSDNGYQLGDRRSNIDKRVMYEASIRVPLLARWPAKVKAGARCEAQVINNDFAPTILAAAGATPPDAMQGRSMLPLLNGEKAGWREAWLYEYFKEDYAPGIATMVGVRGHRYKYIHYPELPEQTDEFYDLHRDPWEMSNLIDDPAYADVRLLTQQQLLEQARALDYPRELHLPMQRQ